MNRKNSGRSAKRLACRARVLLAKVPIALKRAVGLSGPSSSRQSAPILQQWSEQVCRSFEAGQAMSHSDANCAKPRTGFRSRPAPSTVARACARYGVLVVGEEMKGLVNCNFLPGSARRLELGTVSPEPLSRAYWSQKLRPLGETVGLSRARTSGESPDSTQAGRGPQWPIQLAAISAVGQSSRSALKVGNSGGRSSKTSTVIRTANTASENALSLSGVALWSTVMSFPVH